MSLPIAPSPFEFERWGESTIKFLADYFGSLSERPVFPDTSSDEIRDYLKRELPQNGTSFDDLLAVVRDVIIPFSRQNAHPRMFGYVQSPGTGVAALADLLASSLNANLTAWRSAPAAVEIERLTINWIKQILGFDDDAAGLFVSGGSMANFSALATARHRAAGRDFHETGRYERRLRLYASKETHYSIEKAAAILGIGTENVRYVEVDTQFKIRIADLVDKIEADLADGHQPFCVVANAGTVNTGACDPLGPVKEVARRYKLWLHVDASYGGFAILAPSTRAFFEEISEADSVALDPHKWLYLSIDCGCVIYRDAESARSTFAHQADYTQILGHEADEAFAFWDYGPELSRRFRALKVWMLLKGVGLEGLSEAIENNLSCARHFESMVNASEDFEMLAPVELSIFCFRYIPANLRQRASNDSRTETDALLNRSNERLLIALQRDGSSYLSNTVLGGKFALRGCVLNYRTTKRDMEILLEDLRRLAATL